MTTQFKEVHKNSCGCSHSPTPEMPKVDLAQSTHEDGSVRTNIRIMQMDCPTEEGLIRKKFNHFDGIHQLEFNLIQRVLTVVHQPEVLPQIIAAIKELGFEPELPNLEGNLAPAQAEKKQPLTGLIIAAGFAVLAETAHWLDWSMLIVLGCSLVAVLLSGLTTYKKGWIAIRHGNLNINALMSIAVTGAILIGSWPEAAMVMVLFTLAELIEAKSLARARNAIGELVNLMPTQVMMQQANGEWQWVEAKLAPIGARIRVQPGEQIGLDGVVVHGHSTVNQAPITGESLAVEKNIGDDVFAGTINQAGSFEYTVSALAENTTLARIIHAVEQAQGDKAPTQRFVDRFAQVYTPIVFLCAIAIAVVPPIFLAGDWLDWIYKALVLLVIACPCALVISTPVTVVSGLAAAAKKGILIKGGAYLETGYQLKTIALDKTGTITSGQPQLTDFILLSGDQTQVRSLLASLAHRSDHPVSQAIAQAHVTENLAEVEQFEALLGKGTQANIQGERYWLGNHRLIHELGCCSLALEQRINDLEQQGKTVVLLCNQQQVLAIAAVADTIKATSYEAIQQLHDLGIQTVMLSGDNAHAAQVIAQQVGIHSAQGGLLPEDKLEVIHNLSKQGKIAMVGDGINDAPALARADIGFSMGAMGSDTAIETADIALMDDDLRKLPSFIRLSNKTHHILIQNIGLALGIKLVFLLLTLANIGTMWMAVFADVGVSLLVVANGLRLLKTKF
ncbi:heavy metal translocating P-type ATPase [Acinetobacter sp. MD2(2019)]|uniref:heavy metal translocating P-type ATPase n=1 Tax=Acinetobacter sp. MD2(2019) TaxID=2605273 RepID=UPI002D1F8FBF|nr:heavy metal translocating P-type ATPase [Acinetobacter sp. MD2(2019)]MEB3754583.1 heavy metal translocating P-type ATPase [Acinetobacter sp. MD2(2019)]